MRVILRLLAVLILAVNPAAVLAQTDATIKFDSYGRLTTDDEAARLDLFFDHLQTHPNVHGYLVGYNQPTIETGVFLRRLHGDAHYLVEMRGLTPDRLSVIDAGYRPSFTLELWAVTRDGAPPPLTPSLPPPAVNKRELYDEECLECEPAVMLDLYGLSDGLRFYADRLQRDARARGLIIVRPSPSVSVRFALNQARRARYVLTNTHHVRASPISIAVAPRRKDNLSTAQFWIIRRPR
jgi:hypothetical protein